MKNILSFAVLGTLLIVSGCGGGRSEIAQNIAYRSPFDEEALFVAVKKNDSKYCEKIATEELKKDCEQKINDQKIYYQALEQKSEKKCQEIQTQQLKDLCTEQLKDEKDEMKKEQALREKEDAEIKKEAQIEVSGNIKDCDTLTQSYLKAQCQLNIATSLAAEKGDSKYCQQIEEKSLRKACEKAVKG